MSLYSQEDSLADYTEDGKLMIQATTRVLQQQGVDANVAPKMGVAVIDKLMNDFGGAYLPRGLKVSVARRNQKIRREFDGRNHRELANKYQLTEISIRSIVQK